MSPPSIEMRRIRENSVEDYAIIIRGKIIDERVVPIENSITVIHVTNSQVLCDFNRDASKPLLKAEKEGAPFVDLTLDGKAYTLPYDMGCQLYFTVEEWYGQFIEYLEAKL